MKGFFFFLPEKKKKETKTWVLTETSGWSWKGKILSGLFYITVISDFLQCALTSLNERYMSFASCFLRLGYRKIKLRWISLEMSKSRKKTRGNIQILTGDTTLTTALQYCWQFLSSEFLQERNDSISCDQWSNLHLRLFLIDVFADKLPPFPYSRKVNRSCG